MTGLPDVEQLAPEREDPVVVATYDPEPGDGQRLGRVALGEDERAGHGVLGARVVRVVQLGDALQLRVLGRVALLVELRLRLELHPVDDALDDAALAHLDNTEERNVDVFKDTMHYFLLTWVIHTEERNVDVFKDTMHYFLLTWATHTRKECGCF